MLVSPAKINKSKKGALRARGPREPVLAYALKQSKEIYGKK